MKLGEFLTSKRTWTIIGFGLFEIIRQLIGK